MSRYNLVGVDGNAFSVMGYVREAMRVEHKTRVEIDEYTKDAMSGDYDHLLAVSLKMVDSLNEKYDDDDDDDEYDFSEE